MQDKYTGDIGDFGKYILLKKIYDIANPGIRLGVNWYYCTAIEPHSTDGKHVSYLSPTNKHRIKFIQCDHLLYDQLSKLINTNQRSIKMIENTHIISQNTIFYSNPLPERSGSRPVSRTTREEWFNQSLHELRKADIIFLDPDNGIAPASAAIGESRAVKYSIIQEIEAYYKNGKSVIVYNHRDRSPEEHYNRKLSDTGKFLGCAQSAKILRFKRVSVRDYLILPQPHHENIFNSLMLILTKEPYNFLFDKIK